MRGVEKNRKGIGSTKCLGKWMLSWALPFICSILAPAGFSTSRRAMQGALAEDEFFKWLPAVCFIMFCACLAQWLLLLARDVTLPGSPVAALTRFYGKREGPKWKLWAAVNKSSHGSWGCAGAAPGASLHPQSDWDGIYIFSPPSVNLLYSACETHKGMVGLSMWNLPLWGSVVCT